MPRIRELELVEFDHVVAYRYSASGERLHDEQPETKTTRRFGVRLRTDDGLEGSYVVLWSAPPLAVSQVSAMARTVIGMDLHDRELIWDRLNMHFPKSDRIAAGAIDIALWDAAGKAAGLPIAALLGRYRERLPVYVSTLGGGRGLGSLTGAESYGEFAASCAEQGIPAFKVHGPWNGDVRSEIAYLEAAARGAAGRLDLMTDPGGSLRTLADALALGRACDDVRAFWWEDPMRDNSPVGHKILRERVRTPLLKTEFVRGLEMRMSLALAGATDLLRADPELDMGITGVMKTAHAAESIGLDLEVHASGPAQRHCMAAIRNTNYYELGLLDPESGNPTQPNVYADGYVDDLSAVGDDGCVEVPSGMGLGVSYDWERIHAAGADSVIYKD